MYGTFLAPPNFRSTYVLMPFGIIHKYIIVNQMKSIKLDILFFRPYRPDLIMNSY